MSTILLFLLATTADAATIEGRISGCSRGEAAVGSVVKAFEVLRVGVPGRVVPCAQQQERTREVGSDVVDRNGGYSITYDATPRERGDCAIAVFIQVFAPGGNSLITTSERFESAASVTISLDAGNPAICGDVFVPVQLEIIPGTLISGGPPAIGRVTLERVTGAVPRPTTVRLFASDPSAVVMDDTLTIPAGQTIGEFDIRADSPEPKIVTIFASANDATTQTELPIQGSGPWKGFINDDGARDISDAVYLLTFLFLGGDAPEFRGFADVNGSSVVDISDAVALLGFLFTAAEVPALCERDASVLPSRLALDQELVTDGARVIITGELPAPVYRVVLKGSAFPGGRLVAGTEVLGDPRLVYCNCQPVVRGVGNGPDGESFFQLVFNVPLDAPSGIYEVYVLPDSAPCPAGNAVDTGCLEDSCAIGPLRLFVQPSHIVSIWDELVITDDSEPRGDSPSELLFTFASQTGVPFADSRFPIEFADSYPGGRPGSQHLTSGADPVTYEPQVPVFVGREADMERTECEEECASAPDPARCRVECAEASRNMNSRLTVTMGGAEFDCLQSCSSIWDEVARIGATALGCFAGAELGNVEAGCSIGSTVGGIVEGELESALEDEDDVLGTAAFNFTRGAAPFWAVGASTPLGGLSRTDIDMGVSNHRLPAFHIVEATLHLRSITLVEAGDEPCDAPDEIFFETRASLGLAGQIGQATRLPNTSGISMAEGATVNLSALNFSLPAGGGAESSLFYVEIGVWDFDGEDEHELIGLHSRTFFLGDVLEARGVPGADFVTPDGREQRRRRIGGGARVTGWTSEEQCECVAGACAINPREPHGIADILYEIEIVWEKFPSQ